jgi:hypothetical protein
MTRRRCGLSVSGGTWPTIAKLPQTRLTPDLQEMISVSTGAVRANLVQAHGETPEDRPRPGGVASRPRVGDVDGRHSRDQRHATFQLASAKDVETGGRYDGRSGAINTDTHA